MMTFEYPSTFDIAYGVAGFSIFVIAAVFLAIKKHQNRS